MRSRTLLIEQRNIFEVGIEAALDDLGKSLLRLAFFLGGRLGNPPFDEGYVQVEEGRFARVGPVSDLPRSSSDDTPRIDQDSRSPRGRVAVACGP